MRVAIAKYRGHKSGDKLCSGTGAEKLSKSSNPTQMEVAPLSI